MISKTERGHKGRAYATIIGLVLAVNILMSAIIVFVNYPTEAHRAVARQLDVLSVNMLNGDDFTKIMDSKEYKSAAESPEANYSNMATAYTLLFNAVASIALIGAVYHYLRKRRFNTKFVGATVLLVSIGQLVPLVFTQFGSALYLGTRMPGIGSVAFMLFTGIVIAPLVILLVTRIFDWQYNRKHSFVID